MFGTNKNKGGSSDPVSTEENCCTISDMIVCLGTIDILSFFIMITSINL